MDLGDYARFPLAFLVVLGLLGLSVWGLQRLRIAGSIGAGRRLRVIEAAALDGKTRIALVACDDREHLIALHPSGPLLIESRDAARPAPPSPETRAVRDEGA